MRRKNLLFSKWSVTPALCYALTVTAATFLWIMPVHGAHPLITDDTGTQGTGRMQIELSCRYDRDDELGTKSQQLEAKAAFAIGLYEPLDVIFEVPYAWYSIENSNRERRNGFIDIQVALKWRFFESAGLSLALKPFMTLPAGDSEKGLGSGRASLGLNVISSLEKEPMVFHFNLGFTRSEYGREEDRDANRGDLWNASLGLEYKLAESVRLVADLGARRNPDVSSRTHPAFVLLGVIHSPLKNIDIDAGVLHGLNAPEADLSLMLGLTYRF